MSQTLETFSDNVTSDNINSSNIIKNESRKFILKNYFSYSELEKLENDEILKIFEHCHLITFISNIYLETKKKLFWCCAKRVNILIFAIPGRFHNRSYNL